MARGDAATRRWKRELPFLVFCLAVALSMFRTVDEPSVSIHGGGTEIAITPTDLSIALLAVFCVARLLGRRTLPQPARAITAAAVAFSAWILISSALNGFTTFVGAVKLLEYGVLALGAILFVQRRAQLWQFVAVVVALAFLADFWAIWGFGQHPGARQSSFTGAHDLAALCSMSLIVAFAALFCREHRLGRLPLLAGIAGAVGCILGAALASLLGLYLGAAALILLAFARRALNVRAIGTMAVVLAVVTAGALSLRQGELGFLNELFGSTENSQPGQYAASWSQRLVFTYIGGRVFLANPVVGTGWYGELPPREWARFLPDAKRKFPDQPANYFPKPTDDLIPQQTYDQILFELGIVGGVLFLVLGVLTVRTAVRVGLRWPPGPDEPAAYLPAGWTASLAGAIAGAALFGGIPITAIFWLTIGLVALVPSLAPPAPAPVESAERRRVPATVS